MSAYCNLAGLFPPQGSQVWNENLLWQPISVHTVPADLDHVSLYVSFDAGIDLWISVFSAKLFKNLSEMNNN